METRAASSEALKPMLDEAVPDQLVENVRAMAAKAAARDGGSRAADAANESASADNIIAFRRPEPTAQTPRRPSSLMMALAASLLIVVGGVGGYFAGGAGRTDVEGPQVAGLVDPIVSGILDQRASGEEIVVGDGQVRLVSTFTAGGEQICREYEMKRPDQPDFVSIACRSAAGWQTQLAMVTPETGEGFAPASSLETVDAYLTSIGAGREERTCRPEVASARPFHRNGQADLDAIHGHECPEPPDVRVAEEHAAGEGFIVAH
eukprot:gene5874-7491_t